MRTRVLGFLISIVIGTSLPCMPASAADELPVSLTVSGPEITPVGDTIMIRAVFKNVSTHTIHVVWGDPYAILVHSQDGKDPNRLLVFHAGSSGVVPLESGQTFPSEVNLSHEYDLSVPGSYTVQFERHLDGLDPKSPIVDSNKITITVVPPKKDEKK